MLPSRFSLFGLPGGSPPAAQRLFEHGHSLQISIHRGRGGYGPFITFELSGALDSQSDRENLTEIATELLRTFHGQGTLPPVEPPDDEDERWELAQ